MYIINNKFVLNMYFRRFCSKSEFYKRCQCCGGI